VVVGYCHPHIQEVLGFPDMILLGVSTQDNLSVCVWFEWNVEEEQQP